MSERCFADLLPGSTTAAKVTDVSAMVSGRMCPQQCPEPAPSKSVEVPQGHTLQTAHQFLISGGHPSAGAGVYPAAEQHSRYGQPWRKNAALRPHPGAGAIYLIFSRGNVGHGPGLKPKLAIAIVEAGTLKYGMIVDKFLTEVEVLVKPLTGGLEQCKEFQGAAIMGDGRVVLVLNALECHSLSRAECS
jgi:hypothetical protein